MFGCSHWINNTLFGQCKLTFNLLASKDISLKSRVTFHSSFTIQSYEKQFNILTNETTALGVYWGFMPKDLVGSLLIGEWKVLCIT